MHRLAALAAAGLLAAATLVPAAAPAAAAGRVLTASPSDNLHAVLRTLAPGDTLRLAPGTYDVSRYATGGYLRPLRALPGAPASQRARVGTAAAPIRITALDPARKPLLRGGLRLDAPDYWALSHLRVQATASRTSALYVDGGIGWSVTHSEFFGAGATDAYANVAVSGGERTRFVFARNCVRGAATGGGFTDHNIYLSFAGGPSSSARIERNVVFGHPNGAGIKVGNGGAPGAPGPWNVKIANNTLANGGRQVLLHGDVRRVGVYGNILYGSTKPFTGNPKTTAVYVNGTRTATGTMTPVKGSNRIGASYVHGASMWAYDPSALLANAGDNALRATPGYRSINACAGYVPTTAAARPYGHLGTRTW